MSQHDDVDDLNVDLGTDIGNTSVNGDNHGRAHLLAIAQHFLSQQQQHGDNSDDGEEVDSHRLLHAIVDEMCGRGPGLQPLLLLRQQQQQTQSSLGDVVEAVKSVLGDLVAQGVDPSEARDVLQKRVTAEGDDIDGVAPAVTALATVYAERHAELVSSLRTQSVERIAQQFLRDFDWRVQLTVASDRASNTMDSMAGVGSRRVMLKLALEDNTTKTRGKDERNRRQQGGDGAVVVELDVDALDRVLAEMDRIERAVQRAAAATDTHTTASAATTTTTAAQ